MNKLYSVHDHWTDINKKNDVDIESIDGVITGIKVNGEDFGGESWETLFDGNVTTEDEQGGVAASSELNVNITANTIKVTFNNTEYICNKDTDYISFGAAFDAETGSFDFSEYPFGMMFISEIDTWNFFTPSSGTYSLKIEEPQSGGSSDFSIAVVTLTGNDVNIICPTAIDDEREGSGSAGIIAELMPTANVILYKGHATLDASDVEGSIEVTGDIELVFEKIYDITGDCTITIS